MPNLNNPTPPAPASAALAGPGYESNPFLNAASGLRAILQYNAAVSMLSGLIVIAVVIALYAVMFGSFAMRSPWWILVGMLVYLVGLLLLVPFALGLYVTVAVKSGRGQAVTLSQASSLSWSKLWPMLGMYMVIYLGTSTGLCLFIVPGLIFLARSLLAPLYMLDENLGPIAAIDRSFHVTKGHTFELMGSMFAGMLMGGGYLLAPAVGMAPLLGRYLEIRQLEQSGAQKPKTHWLNYASVFGGFLIIALIVGFYTWFIVSAINEGAKTAQSLVNTQTQASPTPTPGLGTSAVEQAEDVATRWLQSVQQGDMNTAYSLEDPSYQQRFTIRQQTTDTSQIRASVTTNTFVSSVTGHHGDGATEMLVAVYKSTTSTGQPYYIQIDVQSDGTAWKVWGYNTSYDPIAPKLPQ